MLNSASLRSTTLADRLLILGLVVLPMVTYAGMAALLAVIILTLVEARGKIFYPPTVQALGLLSIGLVINTLSAFNVLEAALQLANFIPFFLLFAVFIHRLRSPLQIYYLAWSLVFGSIPINVVAVVEYIMKIPAVKDWIDVSNLVVDWFYRHDYGHRSNSVFGHPNTYVSYLILMLALGMGLLLLLKQRQVPDPYPSKTAQRWLLVAIGLMGLGIFFAGSRNGLAVAFCELVVFAIAGWQQSRFRWWLLGSIGMLIGTVLVAGVGGRTITLDGLLHGFAQDPRPGIWQIALDLAAERPWLGWGLGNFKFLYPPRSIRPDYVFVAHAHNFWLQCLAEIGVVLTLGFCLIIGAIAVQGFRRYAQLAQHPLLKGLLAYYLLSMGSFMLFAMLDVPYYDARINALNWLMVAAVYRLAQNAKTALLDPAPASQPADRPPQRLPDNSPLPSD